MTEFCKSCSGSGAWESTVRLLLVRVLLWFPHCSFLCPEQCTAVGSLPSCDQAGEEGWVRSSPRSTPRFLMPLRWWRMGGGPYEFFILLNLNKVMVEDAGQPINWPGYLLLIQDFTRTTVPVGTCCRRWQHTTICNSILFPFLW